MRYLFISPHLDDVALSVGGIVHFLSRMNMRTEIWTIFSGSPEDVILSGFAQSLHQRWKLPLDAPKTRRLEDRKACRILGADYKHFNLPDCIYRHDQNGKPIILEEDDLYQPIPTSQQFLVTKISKKIKSLSSTGDIIVSPLSIGNHVDHHIVVAAIRQLTLSSVLYYEDYPYVIKSQGSPVDFLQLNPIKFDLQEEDIRVWHAAVAEFQSQISTFWENIDRMTQEIKEFAKRGGGTNLWK